MTTETPDSLTKERHTTKPAGFLVTKHNKRESERELESLEAEEAKEKKAKQMSKIFPKELH
jgi:hypothetical protein